MWFQTRLYSLSDVLDGVSIFKDNIKIRNEVSIVIVVFDQHKKFVFDSCNFCICKTVFHWKNCKFSAAITLCGATVQDLENTIFITISNITCMQPDLAVCMCLKCFCCRTASVITQHGSRA